MITAREALAQLIEGNRRFVAEEGIRRLTREVRRNELVDQQQPFAVILGCSDSRVPAEIIFDQCLGDLFVVRVAGNIAAPTQIGSVEFAVDYFGTRLVVVLGHSGCGAVLTALEEAQGRGKEYSDNVHSIIDRIVPVVRPLLETELKNDQTALVREAVRANTRSSANQLRHGSASLEKLIDSERILVVGAKYSLETGVVDFFDVMPEKSNG